MGIKNILLALVVTFLWGAAFPIVKSSLEFVPPFLLAGLRFITAFLFLIPFVGFRKFLPFFKKEYKIVLFVGVFQTLIQYALFFHAMNGMSAAKVSVLVGLSPILVVVLAHFLLHDDKMSLRKIVSVVVGVCGAITITLAKSTWVNGENDYFEVLLMFLAMLSSGLATIYIKKKGEHVNAMAMNSGQLLVGGVGLFIIGVCMGDISHTTVNTTSVLGVLSTGLISAFTFTTWFHLLKKVSVSSLNVWKSFIPVSGTILSWVFLTSESFNVPTLVGVILVVLAIVIMNVRVRKRGL